jgi:hypothetical protein
MLQSILSYLIDVYCLVVVVTLGLFFVTLVLNKWREEFRTSRRFRTLQPLPPPRMIGPHIKVAQAARDRTTPAVADRPAQVQAGG